MSKEFVWTDKLVEGLLIAAACNLNDFLMAKATNFANDFKQSHTPKEDNKDWEVTCATGFTKEGGLKIISVKRLSDNEVFSVGDEVVHKTNGLINTAKILKFVLPEVIDNKMWFEYQEGDGFVKDLANFDKLKPKHRSKLLCLRV